MKPWGLLLVVLVPACSSSPPSPAPHEEPATATETPRPPEVAVLFERVLGGYSYEQPLFGPDGGITVGARRWSADGAYLGRHAWALSGQLRPRAITGTADHPLVIVSGWSDLDAMPAVPAGIENTAWLIAAEPGATKPTHATPSGHDFLGGGLAISPSGTSVATIEGDEIVVRGLAGGTVLARTRLGDTGDDPLACWIDDAQIAWITRANSAYVLHSLGVHTHAAATEKLALPVRIVACDPAGGAAAIEVGTDAVGVLDLATGVVLASVAPQPPTDPDQDELEVAVGGRGTRLAIVTGKTFTLYQREDARLSPLFTHALERDDTPRLQFSADGSRLALSGPTLIVLGPKADARARPPLPHVAFELPDGFTAISPSSPELVAWRYAQLPAPSGFSDHPALLVSAVGDGTEVVGVVLDREELTGIPAADASDGELAKFGQRAMAQLFERWVNAEIGTARDADFTLKVGRTKGMPWIETREVWRVGCEPYDGYTRIVIDPNGVFVIRALTIPAGPIDGWLTKFFDLPFGARVQTARRAGPRTGPC